MNDSMTLPDDPPIRVLMITTGWPTPGRDNTAHFIKRQADFLRAAGVAVDVLHFVGRHRPMNYVRGWLRAQAMLIRGRYDLVHAQWGQSALVALPKRLPLVVTYRGGDLHGLKDMAGRQTSVGRLLQWLSLVVARRADAVILVSAHMKEFLVRERLARVDVIPSGLDCELFRPMPRDEARRRLGLPPDRRLVLFAGDPACGRKRYPIARAAVEVLNRTLPAEMVIGWNVAHDDMPSYMNACDAMIFTSRQEGSPNVVKEALACNLPVVSVPVGDVAERIGGIEGCELCPDERPEALAAALERVLRRGGRAASRESVLMLAEDVLTQRVIAIYRSVLGPGREAVAPTPAGSVPACST